jgi:hypothetical protein
MGVLVLGVFKVKTNVARLFCECVVTSVKKTINRQHRAYKIFCTFIPEFLSIQLQVVCLHSVLMSQLQVIHDVATVSEV